MLLLSLNTLCNYTDATPSTRNVIKGERAINSGFIIVCGTTCKAADRIDVFSLCLRTSGLASEPHTITGNLSISQKSKIHKQVSITIMDCTCKAGTSHCCQHIVATLLYCNRKDLNSLEMLSSTDTKYLWSIYKQPVMELYEALPLRTFCCVKVERLPPLPVEILLELRHNFIKCDSETALAKHSNRKRKSTENGHGATIPQRRALCDKNDDNKNSINSMRSNYLSQICGGNQESNVENVIRPVNGSSITLSNFKDNFLPQLISNAEKSETVAELANINVPMQNCCQNVFVNLIKCIDVLKTAVSTFNNKYVWKKERQLRITGSSCYSIFTYSQNNWLDKSRRYFWPKEISTDATRHGNEYEPVAREMYRKQTNQCVRETGLFVSKTEPWLAYCADGIIKAADGSMKLLEIKCHMDMVDTSNECLKKKCKYLKFEGNNLKFNPKHAYYAQIQFGMALLNLNSCDFVIYSDVSNTIRIITVNFDKPYAQKLLNVLKNNYFKEMLHTYCKFSQKEKTFHASSNKLPRV